MSKIKCVVKRPDEKYGHSTYVSDTLENLQQTVDGYVEAVTLYNELGDIIVLCDEHGRLKDKEPNFTLNGIDFVGTVMVCGTDGEEFADIPVSFDEWKKIVDRGVSYEKPEDDE